jgi:Protein of unknown function (DUF3306)
MNDPDNFLSRWSRRKQEAGERNEKKEEAAGKPPAEPAAENEPGRVASAPDATPIPKLDVENLPPIESITADTDITAFMRAGVPDALKRAALRRAWSSDPAIRDFVEVNENYWDAAGPDGIPGFGDVNPNLDVKRMVSELFGEIPREDTSSKSDEGRVVDSPTAPAPNQAEAATLVQPESALVENIPPRSENAAPQTEVAAQAEAAEQSDLKKPVPEKKIARRHGGAIPQ